MDTDDDQAAPRKVGRPRGTTTKSDRWRAHSEAHRDLARARLRIARHRFERAEAEYWAAIEERQLAALDAYAKGLNDPEIGRAYDIPAGHVSRMRNRPTPGRRPPVA